MDNVYVYVTALPDGMNEAVLPCADGHTVYINEKLDQSQRIEAYNHAIKHIENNDWEKSDVQIIESEVRDTSEPFSPQPAEHPIMSEEEIQRRIQRLRKRRRRSENYWKRRREAVRALGGCTDPLEVRERHWLDPDWKYSG